MFARSSKPIAAKVMVELGAFVTGLGIFVGGKPGYWLQGYGLAHAVLGTLDIFRQSMKKPVTGTGPKAARVTYGTFTPWK